MQHCVFGRPICCLSLCCFFALPLVYSDQTNVCFLVLGYLFWGICSCNHRRNALQNYPFFNLVSSLHYFGWQSEGTSSQRCFAGKTNKKPITTVRTGFTDFIALCTAANRFTGPNRRNPLDGGLWVAGFEFSVCHSAKTSAQWSANIF